MPPPISESSIASSRNCRKTSARLAPIDCGGTDLARALGDRDEHDVHDADAGDDEGHAADRREAAGEHGEHRVEARQLAGGVLRDVFGAAPVEVLQFGDHGLGRGRLRHAVLREHLDEIDVARLQLVERGVWDLDVVAAGDRVEQVRLELRRRRR